MNCSYRQHDMEPLLPSRQPALLVEWQKDHEYVISCMITHGFTVASVTRHSLDAGVKNKLHCWYPSLLGLMSRLLVTICGCLPGARAEAGASREGKAGQKTGASDEAQ